MLLLMAPVMTIPMIAWTGAQHPSRPPQDATVDGAAAMSFNPADLARSQLRRVTASWLTPSRTKRSRRP
jgi:hypothetical protein